MRRIDADDLKEHKFLTPQVKVIGGRHGGKLKEQIIQAYQKGWNDCIDAIIDNAPTVEPCYQTTSCLDCKNYDNENHNCPRYCEVIKEALEETKRPHGKWIEENSETGAIGIKYTWVRCNQCGWNNSLVIPKNFCPNCGADMRG